MKDRFPQFKYSNVSPTRVSPQKPLYGNNELHMAIPYGKKYYAWFTFHKTYDVCVFMNSTTGKFYYEKVPFSSLSLGTVLYGTLIEEAPHPRAYRGKSAAMVAGACTKNRFVAENMFYFEGRTLEGKSFFQKLELFNRMFCAGAGAGTTTLTRETPIYLTPMWRGLQIPSFVDISKTYTIYVLATTAAAPAPATPPPPKVKTPHSQSNIPSANEKRIFYVKADIINDIYHLFNTSACSPEQYHSIAFIPDYKTSVFMNTIFRKIKENINLDYLEESDDDEDFEDTRYDKYVNLEKIAKISCIYNTKFKKWVPKNLM